MHSEKCDKDLCPFRVVMSVVILVWQFIGDYSCLCVGVRWKREIRWISDGGD